ncbi:MAG TPA: hypothetical protein VKU82_04285 [Planctomycetaceae bacterium]|nr:hypothetical protein [Planctomycetaceae bacterium]
MNPTQELIDQIYRERVLRARRQAPDEKFFAGPRLFERACRLMIAGIRDQFPEADDAQVSAILNERLQLLRRLEKRQ